MTTTLTIPDHVVDQAKHADLLRLAEGRTELHRESGGEYAGPCPKCAGEDRFHVTSEWFFCRQCHEKRGDPIDFVMWLNGFDFKGAVEHLTGYKVEGTSTPQRKPRQENPSDIWDRPRPKPAKPVTPTDEWMRKAGQLARAANHDLFTNPRAESGREYLLSRCIEPHAWERFNLGFRVDVALPAVAIGTPPVSAVVMPWYRGGKIWAIRYRFLKTHEYQGKDGKKKMAKQTAEYGSHFAGGLYGGHVLPGYTSLPVDHGEGKRIEALRTLVICEGELNAISIWQVTEPWNWDVLSLGSESAKPSQVAIDYASHFGRVLVWMDRAEVAKDLMTLIPRTYGVNSLPRDDGGKLDANDLLQQGLLGEFLARVRLVACRTDEERQRFLYDLYDADQRPPFLDAGARQVMTTATPPQWAEVGERVRG